MFDYIHLDLEHLPRGAYSEGTRKPSEFLENLMPAFHWLSEKQSEWGMDMEGAYAVPLYAHAFIALCKQMPSAYDVELITGDEADGGYAPEDFELYVFQRQLIRLIDHLDDATLPGQRFGWQSDDPDHDGYYLLGVWTDWDKLDLMIEMGECASISDLEDLEDEFDEKVRFLLYEEDGYAALYSARDREMIWEAE